MFITAGCKPGFVDDLRAAIDEIIETLTTRTQRNGDRTGATKGLKSLFARCTKLVGILDSFIQSEAHDDVELLAAWASVKHVRRRPTRRTAVQPEITSEIAAVADADTIAREREPIRDPERLLPTTIPKVDVAALARPTLGGNLVAPN